MKGLEAAKSEKISIAALMAALYLIGMPLTIVPVGGLSMLKIISILVGGVLFVKLFIGANRFTFNGVHFFLVFYILCMVLSLFISSSEYAVTKVTDMIEASVIIFLISMRCYNKREKHFLEFSWLLVGAISIILGLFSRTQIVESRMTISYLHGTEDPNQFCAYFILPLLISIDRLNKGYKYKPLYIVYIILIFFIVLKTGSRGGLIAVVGSSIFYALIAVKGIKKKMIISIGALLLVMLFIAVIFPNLPQETRSRFSIERVQEDKGAGRFTIWGILINEVIKDPATILFGYGIGSTFDILKSAGIPSGVAHNQWLQLWADMGLFGLFTFTTLYISAISRNLKNNMVIVASLMGIFILSLSLTLYVFKPFLNILLMSAMTYLKETEDKNKSMESQGNAEKEGILLC